MKILESSWQDKNGLKLHVQGWEPDVKPKAVVVLLHGLGEHVVRYADVAQDLVKAGFAVMGFDLRGHGRSDGQRGHTPSFEVLLDDVETMLARVAERYPRRPVFLYGHSLGGTLALAYAMRRPAKFEGVIATAPWLRAHIDASPFKAALAAVLDPILPTYSEKSGLKASSLSHDASVGGAYERDPLVHGRISVRMYRGSKQAGAWALEHAAEFPLPLLLMHGTEDKVTSWEASQEFARRLGKKVTWRSWEGMYHELHNEPQRRQVLSTMIAWMNRRLGRKSAERPSAGQKRRGMRKCAPKRRHRA